MERYENSEFYIGRSIDNGIVKSSSSGGAFSTIVHCWFEHHKNSYVFGCIMESATKAKHIVVNSESECVPMRGSKYIPSEIGGCFAKCGELLNNGNYVLFSGTPCQVYSLYCYLDKHGVQQEKLLTVEVICHGVAEQKFFDDYISHLERKYKSVAISCSFRAKRKLGDLQDMQVIFENGKRFNAPSTKYDWFYSLYNNNNILRRACYNCKFACKERYADITLGDSWGNEWGMSLVLLNSSKGKSMLNCMETGMRLKKVGINEIDQPTLFHPTKRPNNYEQFWEIYEEKGYLAAQYYAGNNTIKGKICFLFATIINELGLKSMIKRLLH